MDGGITMGSLVRFTRKAKRYVRSRDFKQESVSVEIDPGTLGIVIGETEGTWEKTASAGTKRPVIFTSHGFRVCETLSNLEVLCSLP